VYHSLSSSESAIESSLMCWEASSSSSLIEDSLSLKISYLLYSNCFVLTFFALCLSSSSASSIFTTGESKNGLDVAAFDTLFCCRFSVSGFNYWETETLCLIESSGETNPCSMEGDIAPNLTYEDFLTNKFSFLISGLLALNSSISRPPSSSTHFLEWLSSKLCVRCLILPIFFSINSKGNQLPKLLTCQIFSLSFFIRK